MAAAIVWTVAIFSGKEVCLKYCSRPEAPQTDPLERALQPNGEITDLAYTENCEILT